MKAARLGRTPAHEICLQKATWELPHVSAPVPPRHSQNASAMLTAAYAATFAHKSSAPSVAFRRQIFMQA